MVILGVQGKIDSKERFSKRRPCSFCWREGKPNLMVISGPRLSLELPALYQ